MSLQNDYSKMAEKLLKEQSKNVSKIIKQNSKMIDKLRNNSPVALLLGKYKSSLY